MSVLGPRPLLRAIDVHKIQDPRARFQRIQPGLGDPAPLCDCSNKPDLVNTTNFATMLVSFQYLLLICDKYCSRNHDYSSHDQLNVIEARSNEDELSTKVSLNNQNLFMSSLLGKIEGTSSTTTTTTSATTTTTGKPPSIFESILAEFLKKSNFDDDITTETNSVFNEGLDENLAHALFSPESNSVSLPGDHRVKKSKAADSGVFAKRWRALDCPTYCSKEVDPVCGSDKVIYKNDCDMRKRTCNRGVTAIPLEDCTLPKGSDCSHKCSKDKDLVCGTDGRTYLNKCFLQVEFCERGIEFSHYGSCLNTTATEESCPESCSYHSSRSGPVCGSDGNVYESECEMKRQTCGQGVVAVNREHCKTTEHCDSGCWRISRLTCGSDGKLYNNGCQMLRKNCGKHVFEMPVPFCLNKMYRTDCPLDCSDEPIEPVCGSDENIYRNMCEMQKMTCGYPLTRYERIVAVSWSLCAQKAAKCARMRCTGEKDEPVCGNDGVTYKNPCLLRRATCTSGVQMVHVGPCTNMAEEETCPKNCDKSEESFVCGSDGNVYRSECEMKLKTCGQRVTVASRSSCQTTKYCDVDCPAKAKATMVCGSDGQFYDSECQMRKENCGRHMYVAPISLCLKNFKFIFSGCGRVCPKEYDPVCGTDNKTYSNQCFMEMENCRARSLGGVTRKYYGKCGEPKQKARYYLYRK